MIEDYFVKVEKSISGFKSIISYNLAKKIISNSFGIINGQIFFTHGTLDFTEVVRITDVGIPIKKKYKYPFRDVQNELIFRYDNVPHHPEIGSFPHHKHIKDTLEASDEPDLIAVFGEIKSDHLF